MRDREREREEVVWFSRRDTYRNENILHDANKVETAALHNATLELRIFTYKRTPLPTQCCSKQNLIVNQGIVRREQKKEMNVNIIFKIEKATKFDHKYDIK